MPAVATPEHRQKAAMARRLLAAYAKSEDLVRIGAYKAGNDEELDRAMQAMLKMVKLDIAALKKAHAG